jgi:ribosomal-protein-alanine N-acetyltransferase
MVILEAKTRIMKQYETQRLILREFNPAVRQRLEKKGEAEMTSFFGSSNYLELLSYQDQFLDSFIDTHRQTFRHWLLVSKEEERVIGDCGFHRWAKIHQWAEVGYGLRTSSDHNKGLMTEALQKVVDIGFQEMGLRRIEAFIETDNLASLKVIHKLGFRAEGRHRARHEQGRKDVIAYSLTLEDEPEASAALPELVDGFERQTLPLSQWNHKTHLEVALWYLLRHDWSMALLKMRNGILAYNWIWGRANTASSGYHETLTQFWLRILQSFLEKHPTNWPYSQHCDALWMSAISNEELPLDYYSRDRLYSVKARAEWIEPDLKEIK